MQYKKSQFSIELLIIFMFMIFLITIIIFILGNYFAQFNKDSNIKEVEDFANSILNEFEILQKLEPGYERTLVIKKEFVDRFNLSLNETIGYFSLEGEWIENTNNQNTLYYFLPGNFEVSKNINAYGDLVLVIKKTSFLNDSDDLKIDNLSIMEISFLNNYSAELASLTYSNILSYTNSYPISLSISGDGNPQLKINSGIWSNSGTISPGDTLQIRLNSSENYGTYRYAHLNYGGSSSIWLVKTKNSPFFYNLVGFAYGENFGYISFNGTNYGVSMENGDLSGFAYSEHLGYISFNGTNYGVSNIGGVLSGFAYGEQIGYIKFNGTFYNVAFNGTHFNGMAYSENFGYINFYNSGIYQVKIS